jgi:deoxycytidine triphosphate deaminase
MSIINPHVAIERGCITNADFLLNVQPNSIDLTVDKIYTMSGTLVLYKDKTNRKLPEYTPLKTFEYEGLEMYRLEPGNRYQVEFKEQLNLPKDICAITLVRSSMAKSGCTGENGLFDSGYSGGTGMMVSVQDESYIQVGASIAQMIFFETEASKLYNGYYQNSKTPLEW